MVERVGRIQGRIQPPVEHSNLDADGSATDPPTGNHQGRIQPPVEHSNLDADGSATDPPTDNHQLESRIPTDLGTAVIPDLGDAVIGMYFIG